MKTDRPLRTGVVGAFAAALLAGLLWIAPGGAGAQSDSAEDEATAKTGEPPAAARPAEPPKPAQPSAGTRAPEKPSKAFQPSDKIPADVPSTFPTDI